jgi:hypothetical protein
LPLKFVDDYGFLTHPSRYEMSRWINTRKEGSDVAGKQRIGIRKE